jgi:hypothetical protein
MSDKDITQVRLENELDAAQLAEVSGAGDCTSTATVGSGGITISGPTADIGNNIVQVYEGMIEATSYAIERIANSLK